MSKKKRIRVLEARLDAVSAEINVLVDALQDLLELLKTQQLKNGE